MDRVVSKEDQKGNMPNSQKRMELWPKMHLWFFILTVCSLISEPLSLGGGEM